MIRYKDILSQFGDANTAANANIKVPGSTPRPPFISAPGNYPYAHNIYFETPETARDKLNFLKDVGAQGVIIWELSNEDCEELITAERALKEVQEKTELGQECIRISLSGLEMKLERLKQSN